MADVTRRHRTSERFDFQRILHKNDLSAGWRLKLRQPKWKANNNVTS